MPYRRHLLTAAFLVLLIAVVAPAVDNMPAPWATLVTIASLTAAGIFLIDIPGSIIRGKAYRAGVRAEIARIEAETAAHTAKTDAEIAAIEADTAVYVAKTDAETAAIYRRTALVEIETTAIEAWRD